MMAISQEQLQSDLLLAGVVRAAGLMSLVAMVTICHFYGTKIQLEVDEQLRVLIRTALYMVAIITLPVMKFIRHVLLRLNQIRVSDKSPKSRYLMTIIVSMAVAESIGLYGFVMYLLGDSFNTLYIFVGLSALAMFLYRPQVEEYKALVDALGEGE